jgi:DNA-binding transcriptional MerR regulator
MMPFITQHGEDISMTEELKQYSLNELTEAAGVSARTVRYYIGEGLLPPPIAAGPRSYYTDEHLDRLKLIGQMKQSYLPLREVRRRLNQFSGDQLATLASGHDSEPSHGMPLSAKRIMEPVPMPVPEPLDSASDYIARALYQPAPAVEESDQSPPPAPLPMGKYEFHAFHEPVENAVTSPEEGSSWRRIQLGDEAELLVREEAYQRNHDRIEWLVNWAKKVFR